MGDLNVANLTLYMTVSVMLKMCKQIQKNILNSADFMVKSACGNFLFRFLI